MSEETEVQDKKENTREHISVLVNKLWGLNLHLYESTSVFTSDNHSSSLNNENS